VSRMGAPPRSRARPEGIVVRHRRSCSSAEGGACSCRPGYQAQAYSPREERTIRRTFASLSEARAWRQETQVAVRAGKAQAPSRTTLAEASEEWLSLARRGIVLTRSGEPYKPSALRSYEEALRNKVLPWLGRKKLSAIERNAVQDLVDRLVAEGRAASTARNAILPLAMLGASWATGAGAHNQPAGRRRSVHGSPYPSPCSSAPLTDASSTFSR
jgi:hypothetical protein